MTNNRALQVLPWFVLLVLETLNGAPRPKLIREINLNALIRESGNWRTSNHPVEEIVFSPDESRIAVQVGSHWKEGPVDPKVGLRRMSHVLVVSLKDAQEQSLQIDVERWLGEEDLQWSPGSDVLAVGGGPALLYAIPSGEPWKYGRPGGPVGRLYGFVDAEHWLMAKPPPGGFFDVDPVGAARQLAEIPHVLDTLDLAGHVVDEWTQPRQWAITAVNPDRHLVIINEEPPQRGSRRLVMDYRKKAVVQEWSADGPFWKPYFAEGGKTLCSVGMNGRDSRPAQCFDIDSGKKISEFSGFKGGDPAAVSAHASRIALSHIRLVRGATEELDMDSYKDRVVWDFRANKEVAGWVPAIQINEYYFNGSTRKVSRWGPFAISPTGRCLAEGTNGILRIYEIQ